jgi:hypothetical protein
MTKNAGNAVLSKMRDSRAARSAPKPAAGAVAKAGAIAEAHAVAKVRAIARAAAIAAAIAIAAGAPALPPHMRPALAAYAASAAGSGSGSKADTGAGAGAGANAGAVPGAIAGSNTNTNIGAGASANAGAKTTANTGANASATVNAYAASGASASAGDSASGAASPAGAASGASGANAGAGSAPAARSSLRTAADTAEKMYYCGELFIFSESMLKTNYEMAAIAARIKSYAQDGGADSLRLGEMKSAYNAAGAAYNSWVDVKAVLEGYVDIIADNSAYSRPNLQSAFRYTLATVNAAQQLLDEADAHFGEPSPTAQQRRALAASADSVVRKSAKAASTIEAYSKRALDGYRKLFDAFAMSAGVEGVALPDAPDAPGASDEPSETGGPGETAA